MILLVWVKKKIQLLEKAIQMIDNPKSDKILKDIIWIIFLYVETNIEKNLAIFRIYNEKLVPKLVELFYSVPLNIIEPFIRLFLYFYCNGNNYLLEYMDKKFAERIFLIMKNDNLNHQHDACWLLSYILEKNEEMRNLFFRSDIINQMIELLITKKNTALMKEILYCFEMFLKTENTKNIDHLVFGYDLLGLSFSQLKYDNSEIQYRALKIIEKIFEVGLEFGKGFENKAVEEAKGKGFLPLLEEKQYNNEMVIKMTEKIVQNYVIMFENEDLDSTGYE